MFAVTYMGYLNVYTIASDKTITRISTQSLLNVTGNGVYCAEIESSNMYLMIGSFVPNQSYYLSDKRKVAPNGVSIWRILNAEPWIKHIEINNADSSSHASSKHKVITAHF